MKLQTLCLGRAKPRSRARRVLPAAPGIAAAFAALLVLAAVRPSQADCAADPSNDRVITCDNPGTGGFTAVTGENNYEVTVNDGATVDNGGSGDAIKVENDNTIGNRGSIDVSGAGNAALSGLDGNTVTNYKAGTIVVQDSGDGMNFEETAELKNLGTITMQGADSVAMRATVDAILWNAVNADTSLATITLEEARSVGMKAGNLSEPDSAAELKNEGTINIVGDDSSGMQAGDGWERDAIGTYRLRNRRGAVIDVGGDNSRGIEAGNGNDIANLGTINVTGGGTSGSIGIETGAAGQIENNRATIDVTGLNSIGVSLAGSDGSRDDIPGTLANSGTIRGDDDTGPLVRLGLSAGGTGLENYVRNFPTGQILADTTTGDRIAIQGSAGADRIENAGTISGDVLLGGGDDRFVYYDGGSLSGDLDGGAGNADTFALGVSAAASTVDFDQLQIASPISNFEQLAIETGSIWELRGTADFETTTIESGATLTWSGGGAATLTGNVVFESGSTLDVHYDASPSTSPLQVDGEATLAGRLLFTADSASGLADGTELLVLHADGGLNQSTFDQVVGATAFLELEPRYDYNANDFKLFVRFSFATAALTSNGRATGAYLDVLNGLGVTGELRTLLDGLESLDTSSYRRALTQLHPEAYDAQASATLALGERFMQLMFERPGHCIAAPGERRRDPRTNTPCRERRWEPWFAPYGQLRRRDGESGHISFRNNGGGLVFGVDRRFGKRLMLSGTLGTSRSILRVGGVGKGRLSAIDLGLFAGYTRGPLQLLGAVSYGHGWHQSYRNVRIPELVPSGTKGTFNSHRTSLRLHGDYGFDLRGWQVAPLVSLDYTSLVQSSLAESGGGALALLIDRRSDSIATLRTGIEVSTGYHKTAYWRDLLEIADGVWHPALSVRWRQVLAGSDREITARYAGAPAAAGSFTVDARAPDRGFEIGAGLDFVPKAANRVTLGVRYDTFLWQGITSHELRGDLRFSF